MDSAGRQPGKGLAQTLSLLLMAGLTVGQAPDNEGIIGQGVLLCDGIASCRRTGRERPWRSCQSVVSSGCLGSCGFALIGVQLHGRRV